MCIRDSSCNNSPTENLEQSKNRFDEIISLIEENGNYFLSDNLDFIVDAETVKENFIGKDDYLLIDVRLKEDYDKNHIEGTINVEYEDLFDYFFNEINPKDYEKILLICQSGMRTTFATSIFMALGINNVYSLKFGTSSWHKDIATEWISQPSDDYTENLVNESNLEELKVYDFPLIEADSETSYEILKNRAKVLLSESYRNYSYRFNKIEDLAEFYIICYENSDLYELGHIPNAHFYSSADLLRNSKLSTLPNDKPILLYDSDGQMTGFINGYLRLLGYETYSVSFGANSFMYDVILKNIPDFAFVENNTIRNYPIISN